jgi:hypothetical protein
VRGITFYIGSTDWSVNVEVYGQEDRASTIDEVIVALRATLACAEHHKAHPPEELNYPTLTPEQLTALGWKSGVN